MKAAIRLGFVLGILGLALIATRTDAADPSAAPGGPATKPVPIPFSYPLGCDSATAGPSCSSDPFTIQAHTLWTIQAVSGFCTFDPAGGNAIAEAFISSKSGLNPAATFLAATPTVVSSILIAGKTVGVSQFTQPITIYADPKSKISFTAYTSQNNSAVFMSCSVYVQGVVTAE
jgi:hypothetical protein